MRVSFQPPTYEKRSDGTFQAVVVEQISTTVTKMQAARFNAPVPLYVPTLPGKGFSSMPAGRYSNELLALANFLINNNGSKPNATAFFTQSGNECIAMYHVYQDNATHLRNGGATTSEAQASFFNFMTLVAKVNGDKVKMTGAYNYVRYFMMPHDGWASTQLNDASLINLGGGAYNPFELHWLDDVSGDSATGDAIYGENITYNVYGAGAPYKCTVPPDANFYKFSSAPDADQWLLRAMLQAESWVLNDFDDAFVAGMKASLKGVLSTGGTYANVMEFGDYWGSTNPGNWGWRDNTAKALYPGYQDPALWQLAGETAIASAQINFLKAAQDEYISCHAITGPFMPLYNQLTTAWSWDGAAADADPNTDWTGFQYRAFARAAHYYYLTGDATAKTVCERFYAWLKVRWTASSGLISIPLQLEKNAGISQGKVIVSGYSPNAHGLVAQALIYLAAKSGTQAYADDARALLDDLKANRKNANGSYAEGDGLTYGFQQCEVGTAYALYQLYITDPQDPPTPPVEPVPPLEAPVKITFKSYPNPAYGDKVTMHYELPNAAKVTLKIYDQSGKLVKKLADGLDQGAGRYDLEWDTQQASAGLYYGVLQAGDTVKNFNILIKK